MNKEEHAEMMCQLSISIAERMYENHLLNLEELEEMNQMLLQKYHPFIWELF